MKLIDALSGEIQCHDCLVLTMKATGASLQTTIDMDPKNALARVFDRCVTDLQNAHCAVDDDVRQIVLHRLRKLKYNPIVVQKLCDEHNPFSETPQRCVLIGTPAAQIPMEYPGFDQTWLDF